VHSAPHPMIHTAVVHTNAADTAAAAAELSKRIAMELDTRPDLLVLFASPKYDQAALLRALDSECRPKLLVGASSAGEFTSQTRGEGLACAIAIRSDEIEISAGVARGMSEDRLRAARDVVKSFRGLGAHDYPHRSALVLTDALAGHADDLVEQLTLVTSGRYQFFGGGAGDDAKFQRTNVFFGTEALTDAVVAVELLSKKPIGVGVGHGWEPATPPMRVTQADGTKLIGLNGLPAADAFEDHARATGQTFDRKDPIPFFLHNILGIVTDREHKLRVPLVVGEDGSVACAAEIPEGARVCIMKTTDRSCVDAAKKATQSALAALQGHEPKVAFFFDCVATRLRMGDGFGLELDSLAKMLGPSATYIGCNTHGQIARAPGQFGGFHNCTAVVCVFPA
jgi:hypothetical protein